MFGAIFDQIQYMQRERDKEKETQANIKCTVHSVQYTRLCLYSDLLLDTNRMISNSRLQF